MHKETLELYFYATKIIVSSDDEFVIENLRRDFSYFLPEKHFKHTVTIEGCVKTPDFNKIKGLRFMKHLKGSCYGLGDLRYVVYKDTLCCYDAREDVGSVHSLDRNKIHHYVYYMIISKVGEKNDCDGFHRIHGLGLSIDGSGYIFAAPMRGGKTTLGLELLKDENVQLYSEDTPLIDAKGNMSPFPIRLGIADNGATDIHDKFKRTLNDECHGRKVLVDLAYYGEERIARDKMAVRHLFFCKKISQNNPRIKKISRFKYLYFLFNYIILGKDVPQRAENIFRISLRSIPILMIMLFLRFQTMWFFFWNVEGYFFYMTPAIDKNACFLKAHIAHVK